ncbi:hypothetical protein, partial [Streptomyces violascens]
ANDEHNAPREPGRQVTSCSDRERSPGLMPSWQDCFVDLSERLAEWTDWDGAAFLVGSSLGMFGESETFTKAKAVFWTDNPMGNALHEVLLQLVAAGVLERREEPDEQFRWVGR